MAANKSEKEIRLEKLEALKKRGIDPYPSLVPTHEEIATVRSKKDGTQVTTVGRIVSLRKHGKIAFLDLFNNEARIQLFLDVQSPHFELLDLLDTGDYIYVSGELFTTKAGELTIKVKDLTLLAKTLLPIPDSWQGLEDVETRYRQRALDFKINEQAREIIKVRSQIIEKIRQFLHHYDFIEIQTPILQPIPGGATAKPFITTHNALETEFYLRISDELYLKRLVAGGFERVFEIGPAFRNEGISHMHNPEFTICEFYWAYQNYRGLMELTRTLVQQIVEDIHQNLKIEYQDYVLDFSGNFSVIKYSEIIRSKTGINIEKETSFEKLSEAVKDKKIALDMKGITVWSELVDELFKKAVRPEIIQPTFVIDYPTVTAPLAKQHASDQTIAEKFQLILAGGFELVNAYSELNDPLEQETRFKHQLELRDQGWEEAQHLDENYIEALKFGLPPTAGWGMGIDRFVMILTNQHSIKEVIPFPTLKPLSKK